MAAKLERALLDAEIVAILSQADAGTVQAAMFLAGAKDGDIAFFLRLVIQGMMADPKVAPADRIPYLTKVCDAFGFAVARDLAARKTFGYALTPRPAVIEDLRQRFVNPDPPARGVLQAPPRALSDAEIDAVVMGVMVGLDLSSSLEGTQAERLTTLDIAVRDALVQRGALPGDLMAYVCTLIDGIDSDEQFTDEKRDELITRLCDAFQLNVTRRPTGRRRAIYELTPKSLH